MTAAAEPQARPGRAAFKAPAAAADLQRERHGTHGIVRMSGSSGFPLPPEAVRARYQVSTRHGFRPAADGLEFLDGAEPTRLVWTAVRHALAAEVGEPQGVRTVVFDLALELGEPHRVLRFAAEPGEEALEAARALSAGLPPERLSAEIKSLASGGGAGAWHPDLEIFEEAALAALDSRRG